MSALPRKADIAERRCHVRFVPKADIRSRQTDVRFCPQHQDIGRAHASATCAAYE